MAKNGIKSFPVKVNIDDEIKLITTEFGQNGFAVIVHMYRFIHSKGYYSEWSKDVGLLFIQEFCHGLGWGFVSEVVECAVRRGVFDSKLYRKHAVLTSEEIQETYLKATCRQKSVKFHKNYALPVVYDFIQNVDKSRKNAYIFDENVDTFLQAKAKVKAKDIEREEERDESPPTLESVLEFFKDNNFKSDYKKFFDYYAIANWCDREGRKVLNWRQKALSWENREKPEQAQKTQGTVKRKESTVDRSLTAEELNAMYDRLGDDDL